MTQVIQQGTSEQPNWNPQTVYQVVGSLNFGVSAPARDRRQAFSGLLQHHAALFGGRHEYVEKVAASRRASVATFFLQGASGFGKTSLVTRCCPPA